MSQSLRKRLGLIKVFLLMAAAATVLVSVPSVSQTLPVSLAVQVSSTTINDYVNLPITAIESAPPQVMLNMTRDHQLFYKAYNDYSDLDSDGTPETSYKHSIDYYGYFDSFKCYSYANNRFEPVSNTQTKYCAGQWSGNFLNWVSTTRFDAVRKLLYGGTRSTDTATETVLERTPLSTDAHSFAKYYNGSDIAQLTPFSDISTLVRATTSSTTRNVATGSQQFAISSNAALGNPSLGDQIRIIRTTNNNVVMDGYVTAVANNSVTVQVYRVQGNQTNVSDWTLTNLSTAGISFCNLTWAAGGQQSHNLSTATYPPLLRVARGNFELWSANERWQCYWRDERNGTNLADAGRNGNLAFFSSLNASNASPRKLATGSEPRHALGNGSGAGASAGSNGEYIVRVQACVSGLIGTERCKQYPSGNTKPIGLLQVYGDDDRIRFGLMTSSYQRNVSGGVLRKNISSFRDETEEATTGVFNAAPASGSIVDTLNRLRLWGYRYDDGTYIGADRENCDFQLVGIAAAGQPVGNREVAEGQCASWGNPVGEVYLESLRYLAGNTATGAFDYTGVANNKDTSLGLGRRAFTDPINSTNYCAALNVLTFTASVSSFDNDQMGGLSALRGSPNVSTFTDRIGAAENIHGGNWFIGNVPSNVNQLCTGKTITSLAAVDGICPEASAIEGSFQIGGAALYARTNRIRNDFPASGSTPAVPPAGDVNSLKVTSYGIELATNTPNITLLQPGTGRKVAIQPVYRLDRSSTGVGPFGSGAIVDFRIVRQDVVNGTGRFYVNWEDSTQGGDYDQDMYGVIDYQFLSGNRIRITTDAVSASTANGQGFGYIISGTTRDGPHFHSGILNYDFLNESATNPITVLDPLGRTLNNTAYADYGNRVFITDTGGCRDCVVGDPPTSVIYDLGPAAAGSLRSPLYYMSKFGGFTDSNGNNLPDLQSEWDSRLADGSAGQDGVPDTYFLVSNPTALESSLRVALDSIVAKTASGTAAAVVSNAREGQGAVYQALYESSRTDNNGRRATWLGTLQSIFIDSQGRLREDNGDKTLQEGDFAADPAIEAFFDPVDRTTKLRRFNGNPSNGSFTVQPLGSLRTLWNAREQLMTLGDPVTQRSYGSLANTGRHILTNIDINQNGVIDAGEVTGFTPGSFGSDKFGVLNAGSQTDAANIVNYVRGQEINGLRSRSIDYDNNGTVDVMRLGDIAQSTPTPVGAPAESFNLLYNDTTYAAFARKYAQRRNVVYVGANDGMLHAFNGGFYDPTLKQFKTSNNGESAHPLGAELWAYVPYNLLPHLRWLTEPTYNHVYYMDGRPRVFDARIFTPESACGPANAPTPTAAGCIHPHGWGTVMVVGMRFGGGPLSLTPLAKPGFNGFSPLPLTMNFRSAYVLMDITNPEAAPNVLAELTDPTGRLGYSTALPTVAAFSQRSNNPGTSTTAEKWYLTFGNGPEAATTATTSQSAALYVYDLKLRSFVPGYAPKAIAGTSNSFAGDPVSVDWDLNFSNDALYFGTVGGSVAAPSGRLYKIDTRGNPDAATWAEPLLLANPGGPITSTPSVALDDNGNRWVYAGTGRFFVQDDKSTSPRQSLFGVIDTPSAMQTTVPFANLVDTTSATVTRGGTVSGVTTPTGCAAINTETALGNCTVQTKGWKYLLRNTAPAERLVSRTSLFGEILFATPFTPSPTLCEGEGNSRLLGLFFRTGAARASVPTFGTVTNGTDTLEDDVVLASTNQVDGKLEGVALHLNRDFTTTTADPNLPPGDPDCDLSVISQTSTAAITDTCAKIVDTVRSGEIDWRDSRRSN